MKIIKTVKKLLKKTIKLFFKGAKVYYKAKLKKISFKNAEPVIELVGISPNELVQIAGDLKSLVRTVRVSHKLPEDTKILVSMTEEGDEAVMEFKDEKGVYWEYEVSRSDYEKIAHEDIDSFKGDC